MRCSIQHDEDYLGETARDIDYEREGDAMGYSHGGYLYSHIEGPSPSTTRLFGTDEVISQVSEMLHGTLFGSFFLNILLIIWHSLSDRTPF